MKRLFLLFALFTLVACNQMVDTATEAASLAPAFGTADNDFAEGLAPSSSGAYVVGYTDGNLHGSNLGGGDAYIRKYDGSGKLLWGRQFGTKSSDRAYEVTIDAADNTYVVGDTKGNLAGSRGGNDAFIRKYGPGGSILWTRQFGTRVDDSANNVMASSRGVYVTGSTYGSLAGPNQGITDAFIRKYNTDGTVAWTRQFGGSEYNSATHVAVDNRGYAYVVGNVRDGGTVASNVFIRQYSPSGSVPWAKALNFGNGDYSGGVAVSGDSVYLGTYLCCRDGCIRTRFLSLPYRQIHNQRQQALDQAL